LTNAASSIPYPLAGGAPFVTDSLPISFITRTKSLIQVPLLSLESGRYYDRDILLLHPVVPVVHIYQKIFKLSGQFFVEKECELCGLNY
jgi:hypothetical protein